MERVILNMIWYLLLWHAIAKLRMHTEVTITILERLTIDLGKVVRIFARKSSKIKTYELPWEMAA